MLGKNSIYSNHGLSGEPDWEIAEELIQADTEEKLISFAEKYPNLLPYYRDEATGEVHSGSFPTKNEIKTKTFREKELSLKDYELMRIVLVKALEIRAAAENISLHNQEDFEKLGFSFEEEDGYLAVFLNIDERLNLDLITHNRLKKNDPVFCDYYNCFYRRWLLNQDFSFLLQPLNISDVIEANMQNLYERVAFGAFDEIINSHIGHARVESYLGKYRIYLRENSIESLWLGVLEKSSGKDSYIGICKNCGKPFFAEKARNHKREFCNNGDKCKMAYYNRKYAEKRREQNNGKNKE